MDRPPRVEARLKRMRLVRRLGWIGPLAVIDGAFLVLLFGDVAGGAVGGPTPQLVSGFLLTTLVLLAGLLDTLRVMRVPDPVLVLSEEGLLDRRIQDRPLPWRDISRIEFRERMGETVLMGIWSEQARATLKPLPLFGYFGAIPVARRLARPFRFAPVSLDLQPLDATGEEIREAVRAHWGEPQRRPLVPKEIEARLRRRIGARRGSG